VLNVAEECTTNFVNDPINKYWTLYDISSSIIAAYIQFKAVEKKKTDMTAQYFGGLATKIADFVMEQASAVSRLSGDFENCLVLLTDIIEVLSPILADHIGGDRPSWQTKYESMVVCTAEFHCYYPSCHIGYD
jgi:hypothetical protein